MEAMHAPTNPCNKVHGGLTPNRSALPFFRQRPRRFGAGDPELLTFFMEARKWHVDASDRATCPPSLPQP